MKILFLCTSNIQRSITAEDYFRSVFAANEYKSAGLSYKYCSYFGSTFCTDELLEWADKVFVMEEMHIQLIRERTGTKYLSKIVNLNIEDKFQYMSKELVEILQRHQDLKFLR